MKYRWILFDADNTLLDYDRAESFALSSAFERAGLAYEAHHVDLYREINGRIWRQLERGEIEREKLKTERFRRLFEAAEVEADPVTFSGIYLECLAAGAFLIDGAVALLDALHAKTGLVLITNGLTAVQRPRLAKSGLTKYFRETVISEEVGSSKPSPDIFDLTFDRIGQPAKGDVLIVGDSLTSDMRGGSNYGIDTCWFNPSRSDRNPDIAIHYEIRHLNEIPELVGLV